MGCTSSTEAVPVSAEDAQRARQVVALGAAFCAEKPATLYMKERCWAAVPPDEDFLIRHAESARELFCVQGVASAAAMKTLRVGTTREPVAHLKRDSIKLAPTFNVFAAGVAPVKIFTIEVQSPERLYVQGGGCAFAEFVSPVTGEPCAVGVEGDWRAKQALVWLEHRDKRNPTRRVGRRQDIARVYRPSRTPEQVQAGARQDDYFVGVAADMDMALVLLLCMALDATTSEVAAL